MADVLRTKVLWAGTPPTPAVERELAHRGLSAVLGADRFSGLELAAARGAVFWFDSANVANVAAVAREQLALMLNYGLRVDLVAPDDEVQGTVQTELRDLLYVLRARVNARTAPEDHEIPENIARHDAGPPPNTSLKIHMLEPREPIDDCDRPLFERAFHDCSEIALTELSGGRSAARVFSVHATVVSSIAGPWPQPYFVKLDGVEKVLKEERKYEVYGPFVPFGLRPSLRPTILGASKGLLVGDFVDRSESLWDVARRNMAAPAIFSLLDVTLGGWRRQGNAQNPRDGSIAEALERAEVWKPENFQSRYRNHAIREGLRTTPEQLRSALYGLRQRYRVAPMHGDLHGENVRVVQDGRAILIDLASVGMGPLTADLAALETSLAFECPPDERTDDYENAYWRAVIDRLYAPETFRQAPQPSDPTSRFCWLWSVVRQIRILGIGVQTCPTEYQSAVAVHLLRRCQWEADCGADRFRRSHGYLVAAKLAADLQAQAQVAA